MFHEATHGQASWVWPWRGASKCFNWRLEVPTPWFQNVSNNICWCSRPLGWSQFCLWGMDTTKILHLRNAKNWHCYGFSPFWRSSDLFLKQWETAFTWPSTARWRFEMGFDRVAGARNREKKGRRAGLGNWEFPLRKLRAGLGVFERS